MTQEIKITNYEIMFTVHTGVTVLIQKNQALNQASSNNINFQVGEGSDLSVNTPDTTLIIPDMNKDYLAEASERGFIMFYELEDEEVVRCTPCQIQQ